MLQLAGRKASGINLDPGPDHLSYLWEWFEEIRNFHRDARDPLKPSELASWAQLRGIALEPFEATTLLHMDVFYRVKLSERKR